MRSQLFGFHIQTQYLFEAILSCPLDQAFELVMQHVRKLDGLSARLEGQHVSVCMGQTYTVGLEIMLNEWDDGVEDSVREIIRHHLYADELTRMRALKLGLTWLWPRMRETATVAQVMLTATIDGDTHVSILVGWNTGATTDDIEFANRFTELFFLYLEQLQIPYQCLTIHSSSVAPVEKRQYGPRADTLEKIQKLRVLRSEYLRGGEVAITRTHTCQLIGITPAIVKRYRPELYERWYDPGYREGI
jgi:hypothetical protein